MFRLAALCLLVIPRLTFAQSVSIRHIDLVNEKVIVSYDLEDSNPNNEYQLNLYTSKDNFTVPMTRVKGDVGYEIKPGAAHKIEWNIKEEFGDFEGDISLEVRGRVFVLFAKFPDFKQGTKFHRGKTYPINWKAGNNNPVHIELFQGGDRINGELNHPNNGTYLLTIPSNSKRGDDYRVRLTDSKRPDETVYTGFFSVRPRIPLIAKIAGTVAIVGAGIFFLSNKGPSGGADDTIPPHPEVPTDNN